jgi:magnesium-transporting ATPase (P-type)
VDIGDILLLKKKAYCPADIVLLDCKDDWCFVDTIEIDGCSQYIIKRPLSLIKG